MKTNLIKIGSVLLFAGLLSCSKDDTAMKEEGTGTLSLSLNDISINTQTKTGEDLSNYQVIITDEDENEIYNVVYSELPDPLELTAANYSVSANSNDLQEAAFDAPYYHGCQDCEITADETTDVNLNCTIANVLVTVNYSDYLKGLHAVSTSVSNGTASLEYVQTEERTGYFKASASLEVSVSMIREEGDEATVKTITISNVEGGQHHVLNVDAADPNHPGTGVIGITLDNTLTEVTNNIIIEDDNGGTTPTPEEPTYLNGDFENYSLDFVFPAEATDEEPIFGKYAKVIDAGDSGKAAELGANDGGASKLGQKISLSAGTYTLSFNSKIVGHDSEQPQSPRVVIKSVTANGSVGVITGGASNGEKFVIPISDTFTQSTLELVIPESVSGTTDIVFWASPKPGTVLIDDIQLTLSE